MKSLSKDHSIFINNEIHSLSGKMEQPIVERFKTLFPYSSRSSFSNKLGITAESFSYLYLNNALYDEDISVDDLMVTMNFLRCYQSARNFDGPPGYSIPNARRTVWTCIDIMNERLNEVFLCWDENSFTICFVSLNSFMFFLFSLIFFHATDTVEKKKALVPQEIWAFQKRTHYCWRDGSENIEATEPTTSKEDLEWQEETKLGEHRRKVLFFVLFYFPIWITIFLPTSVSCSIATGLITSIGEAVPGSTHDLTAFRKYGIGRKGWLDKNERVLADLAYFSHPSCLTMIRKPKKGRLSEEEKNYNHIISNVRVLVENTISRIKIFQVVGGTYRHDLEKFRSVFNVCSQVTNNTMLFNPARRPRNINKYLLCS